MTHCNFDKITYHIRVLVNQKYAATKYEEEWLIVKLSNLNLNLEFVSHWFIGITIVLVDV